MQNEMRKAMFSRLPARRFLSTLRSSGAAQSAATAATTTSSASKRLPAAKLPPLSYAENQRLRDRHLAPALKAHYQTSDAGPIKLASGKGQYLFDVDGRRYLDCVNNVCHVGHCHPRVVAAASTQLSMLNTNSRYLHDNIVRLASEVSAAMPDPLSVCIFVNSGSEANDLALRLARAYTARRDVYCVYGAYHGNSASTLAISPYDKYGTEVPEGSVVLTCPDQYRLGLSGPQTTSLCAEEMERLLTSRADAGHLPAAFIVESLICCGGQVVLPEGYLRRMHELTRRRGGVTIADEVQVGFGRTGTHYWAFEAHGAVSKQRESKGLSLALRLACSLSRSCTMCPLIVAPFPSPSSLLPQVPDIVTIGKPFGNGFPLAAVVTTPEIAEASRQVEYFNTFGGNPVACAVGMEVMRVIEDEGLQENARIVGP